MIAFEDLVPGTVRRFGRYEVTADDVRNFALSFDPQPFHLSDEGAAGTHFKRMAASGWHTGAMAMAMMVADFQNDPGLQEGSLGAQGIDELRWLKPVYPGDVLRCESEIMDLIDSGAGRPYGIVKTRVSVINQDDVVVMRFCPLAMWRRRAAG